MPLPISPNEALTRRQLDVARLVHQGLKNTDIASTLGLTRQRVWSITRDIVRRLVLDPERDARVQIAAAMLRAER
jgi:DNA-binding NarL/FixJ family response regulator